MIKTKIYQLSFSKNKKSIYDLWKQLGDNIPHFNILDGTSKPFLICVPYNIDPIQIFNEFGVDYYDETEYTTQKYVEFDENKFNSNYQINVNYFSKDYYVLEKPYKYVSSLNSIKINEDGYPIDENNIIIKNSMKFPPNSYYPNYSDISNYNHNLYKNIKI